MNKIIEFELNGSEYIELKNVLKVSGLCETGGEAKAAIEQGEVLVDEKIETRKACKIKSGQIVNFKKKIIKII